VAEAVEMAHGAGWEIGQRVPGWLIDDELHLPQNVEARGSRFEIGAVSDYNPVSQRYTVVLWRALDTGDAIDLDMSAYPTLNLRLGITDNTDFVFGQGDSRQGFSVAFNLNLP
jgi:hypothetical protein